MESLEDKDQAEITKERNGEKNKWHLKTTKTIIKYSSAECAATPTSSLVNELSVTV
jgi:hypothetical protein